MKEPWDTTTCIYKTKQITYSQWYEQYDSRDKSVKQYKKIAVKVKEKSWNTKIAFSSLLVILIDEKNIEKR